MLLSFADLLELPQGKLSLCSSEEIDKFGVVVEVLERGRPGSCGLATSGMRKGFILSVSLAKEIVC